MSGAPRDPWFHLAQGTPARIGQGRAGVSLPTREVLSFALAHAQARDAVHARLDADTLADEIAVLGLGTVTVESVAPERAVYLRRPDYGRRLAEESALRISGAGRGPFDLALVLGDGLSATAVMRHGPAVLRSLLPHIAPMGLRLAPVAIASGARVALGDEIGALLGARAVAVLIGERPGLSAADSLGIYLTYAPQRGRRDSERNCISNVRPEGLAPQAAAAKLAWLIDAALTRQLTGVGLKDESEALIADGTSQPPRVT
ncbi:MAG TPA: ethanolamine ammonia-lyase subunit EutC [Hyphomicrobiaceae bacterium]|nr:ethanolamine ammonia-lyase subunit EutC [Hyphomicrobiaceae bacterium]